MTELQKIIKALEIINGKVQELSEAETETETETTRENITVTAQTESVKTIVKNVEDEQDKKPTISFQTNTVVADALEELYQRHKVMADGKFRKQDFFTKVMALGMKELGVEIKN